MTLEVLVVVLAVLLVAAGALLILIARRKPLEDEYLLGVDAGRAHERRIGGRK